MRVGSLTICEKNNRTQNTKHSIGRSRGYGFVKYAEAASAAKAMGTLNGYQTGGKKLKVAYARPQSKEIQNANLYVANIPFHYDESKLKQLFVEFGYVIECRILKGTVHLPSPPPLPTLPLFFRLGMHIPTSGQNHKRKKGAFMAL